jgi:oligopeptide/dipeptide ABC transporter ATP-binding protein
MPGEQVLSVESLSIAYATHRGLVRVLQGVSLGIEKGRILGVVGESGSGKSTLGLSVIGLLPPNAKVLDGSVTFHDREILTSKESNFESVRGTGIAMIFQEPLNSLNPVYRVGFQIAEAIRVRDSREDGSEWEVHDYASEARPGKASSFGSVFSRVKVTPEIRKEIVELLTAVRIVDPESVVNKFPHELSGGMRQRVMIAMALAERPDVLIADEATTALDVTTQAKVLSLIRDLAHDYQTAILLISHDLSVVSEVADDVVVMYLGEAVEHSTSKAVFKSPLHPYTVGLMGSIPTSYVQEDELQPIQGSIPDPSNPPSGCRFHTRCPRAFDKCSAESPEPTTVNGTMVRCHLYAKKPNL